MVFHDPSALQTLTRLLLAVGKAACALSTFSCGGDTALSEVELSSAQSELSRSHGRACGPVPISAGVISVCSCAGGTHFSATLKVGKTPSWYHSIPRLSRAQLNSQQASEHSLDQPRQPIRPEVQQGQCLGRGDGDELESGRVESHDANKAWKAGLPQSKDPSARKEQAPWHLFWALECSAL